MSGFANYVMCLPVRNFYSDVKEYFQLSNEVKKYKKKLDLADKNIGNEVYIVEPRPDERICKLKKFNLVQDGAACKFLYDGDYTCKYFQKSKPCGNTSCFHYCYNQAFFEVKNKYENLKKAKKAFWYNKINQSEY